MKNRPGILLSALLIGFSVFLTTGSIEAEDHSWQEVPRKSHSAWLSFAKRSIITSEYDISWQTGSDSLSLDAAWQAPNRAHNFRTRFTGEGVRVIARTPSGSDWEWDLRLVGYGRDGVIPALPSARTSVSANRVHYQRGDVEVLHVNSPSGLAMRISLLASPWGFSDPDTREGKLDRMHRVKRHRGLPSSEPLHLDLEVVGNLSPVVAGDGQAIDFTASDGSSVLRFAGFLVTDASGLQLPAMMEAESSDGGHVVRILMGITGATFPVQIEGLITSPTWTAESDQEQAEFGFSVSGAGDVNGDGYADVIVGARKFDNDQADEGKAFVYHGSATGLSLTPDWTAEGDQAGADFGVRVSSAGDVNGDGFSDVIVAAIDFDNGQGNEGRVFVYHGSPAGLEPSAAWVDESDQSGALFGFWIASAGDVDSDGYSDVIVGTPFYSNGESNEGGAFLYHGSPSGLSASPDWSMEGGQEELRFGRCVASAGDVDGDGFSDVIIGVEKHSSYLGVVGQARVYLGSSSGISPVADWTAEGDQVGGRFGINVASAGDVNGDGFSDVLIAANRYTHGDTEEGRTYLFRGSASGLAGTPSWTAEGDQNGARFGIQVSTAGDVNADGYSDVIIGANLYDNGQSDEGRAYVYLGSGTGLDSGADWIAEGDQNDANYGFSVGTAGDVNGDGVSDIIVGASGYENGQSGEGRAFVYLGSPEEPCVDGDGDGYGISGNPICPAGPEVDCDDTDPSINPGAVEICDGLDNDCDGATDEGVVDLQADVSLSPTTLNVNSQGNSFSMTLTLTNTCDPDNPVPVDGSLLEDAFISRAGSAVLPDPLTVPCPGPGGDILFERGIVDNVASRNVTSNKVTLRFNLEADGDCRTLDGNRQELLAVLSDAVDGSQAPVCVSGTVESFPFEACTQATVLNKGNR